MYLEEFILRINVCNGVFLLMFLILVFKLLYGFENFLNKNGIILNVI